MSETEFTVGDLRRWLKPYRDTDKLSFAGRLTFYKAKSVGDDEVYIEFNEHEAFLQPEFLRKNPTVKVIFCESQLEDGALASVVDLEMF